MRQQYLPMTIFYVLFLCFELLHAQSVPNTEVLDQLLTGGVSDKVYTGAVAIAGTATGKHIYTKAFGNMNYLDENPDSTPLNIDNRFDLASLSKVIATTSAVALLYQRGYLHLDTRISEAIGEPTYAQNDKGDITVRNCLLHNTGYNPDPSPWYWDPAFGCANTFLESPVEDFSCMDQIYTSLLNETVTQPPGEKFLYSDLGFVTLQMVVGATVFKNSLVPASALRSECSAALSSGTYTTNGVTYSCYFEAFVRTNVFQEASHWLPSTSYLLPTSLYATTVPTLNDSGDGSYTHKRLQGQPSDGDCYAMGGLCGHAGVFSTAPDLGRVLTRMLVLASAKEGQVLDEAIVGKDWLNSTTVKYFTREYNQTQSSRTLGWTVNDPTVTDFGFTGSCGTFSVSTFMHTGYSGTIVCVDPVNELWSVVLTNRAYNCQGQLCPANGSDAVKAIWKQFHTELLKQFQAAKL